MLFAQVEKSGYYGICKSTQSERCGNSSKQNGWRIVSTYYPRNRRNGIKKESSDYESQEAAEAELELYRYALEDDGAKLW